MSDYRKKAGGVVKAEQFSAATLPWPEGVSAVYTVETVDGRIKVYEGDWIVTPGVKDTRYPYTNADFEKTYDAV